MKLFTRAVFVSMCMSLVFSPNAYVYAQTSSEPTAPVSSAIAETALPIPTQDGLAQCFDYYKFGSVQVDLAPDNRQTLSGSKVTFSGHVRNTNPYPVVDGAVYVRVFKKSSNAAKIQSQGYEVVDQFFAKSGISIDGKKSLPISFGWDVPATAIAGDYQLATYFVSQKKFNLSGLSFTNDITGTVLDFKVFGEQKSGLSFDVGTVKVDGNQYNFAAFTPKVDSKQPVPVSVELVNPTNENMTTEIQYSLYSWDGLREENLIDSKKEFVTVDAKKSLRLNYTVTDAKNPVYYLVVESKVQGGRKSILNIRFAREGVEKPRINFPAIAEYPLEKGKQNNLFACVHNSGTGEKVDKGSLVLSILDDKGKTFDTYTYNGSITGSMMGIVHPFTPKSTQSNLIVSALLYVDGVLVDSARMIYQCNAIRDSACVLENAAVAEKTSNLVMFSVIGGAILLLLVALLAYRGHLRRKDVLVAVAFFSGIGFVGVYQTQAMPVDAAIRAEAEQPVPLTIPTNNVQYSNTFIPTNARIPGSYFGASRFKNCKRWFDADLDRYIFINCESLESAGWIQLDNVTLSVVYGVSLTTPAGATIASGDIVPVDSTVEILPQLSDPTQVSWFVSGSTNDSPYGYWDSVGTPTPCLGTNMFGYQTFMSAEIDQATNNMEESMKQFTAYAYFPIVVTRPVMTITPTGTASLQDLGSGKYKVLTPGTINFRMDFAQTTAKGTLQTSKTGVNGCNAQYSTSIFTIPPQVINIPLTAVGGTNNNPNTPAALSIVGTCSGSPVKNVAASVNITPANPADPDAGDTVTYEYKRDDGTGYGPVQSLAGTSFSVTWSTIGLKKISIRAIDGKGGVSQWLEQTTTVVDSCGGGGTPVTVGCSSVIGVGGDTVTWSATPAGGNPSYTYSWNGTTYVTSSVFPSPTPASLPPGSVVGGPKVVAKDSSGSLSAERQCPEVTRASVSGSTPGLKVYAAGDGDIVGNGNILRIRRGHNFTLSGLREGGGTLQSCTVLNNSTAGDPAGWGGSPLITPNPAAESGGLMVTQTLSTQIAQTVEYKLQCINSANNLPVIDSVQVQVTSPSIEEI